MGESYSSSTSIALRLIVGDVYAQTFTPLWTHTLEKIRYSIKDPLLPAVIRVSIQYLKPDGTPTGVDLCRFEHRYWSIDPLRGYEIREDKTPAIQMVVGTNYAFVIQTIFGAPLFVSESLYQPPPSGYPRGKLIKSADFGNTWDTTDLGDMYFAEYGDPPRAPSPYDAPPVHWALAGLTGIDYRTNACIRIATINPCSVVCYVTEVEPKPIQHFITTRGLRIQCLDFYSFTASRMYNQEEDCDSLYHTFYIGGLKEGVKYWVGFSSKMNYKDTPSVAPIFGRVHPGGPTFTKTLRPDAPGDECSIPRETANPCPDHWMNICEATADDDASYIANGTLTSSIKRDLYHIPNLDPTDTAPIAKIRLTIRCNGGGALYYATKVWWSYKTHGFVIDKIADSGVTPTWTNYHLHLEENPATSLPWTQAEVNDLQIGVKLHRRKGLGWGTISRCTQVYCRIYHRCEAYN